MHDRTSIIIALLLALGIASSANAQTKSYLPPAPPKDTSKFLVFKDISIGPYFTAGASRQIANLPDGWTSQPKFANAFGITLDASVGPAFGIGLTALYEARALYAADSIGNNIFLSLGYVALQPSIRIFWLLVGIAFDFPMSGSAAESIPSYQHYTNGYPDQPVHPYTENINVATADIAPATELTATISIPVIEQESATLHFILSANYPLSMALKGTSSFDTTMHFSGKYAPGQPPAAATAR